MTTESDDAIALRDLVKVFRRGGEVVRAVDGLDLHVARGQVFGLLGPNGAGKTTTVEICEGLQDATSGSVAILGGAWDRRNAHALRQRIGVSLQETHFFPKQTVREILTMFASFYDRSRPVDEAIAMVSLEEKAGTRSRNLSGGQRQRLAVATALVGQPELLFLDEPTTGLDPQSRRQLWDVIRAYRESGGTVLLTTHYMDEAEQLCDQIAIIDHGRRIKEGTPAELIASIGGEHVIELEAPGLRAKLVLDGVPTLSTHRWSGDRVTLAVGAPHEALPPILARASSAGVDLAHLSTRHASLEDVFVDLTGRHLRDDDGESR